MTKLTENQIANLHRIKVYEKKIKGETKRLQTEFDTIMLQVCQPSDDDVSVGANDSENVEIRRWTPERFKVFIKSENKV